MTWDGFHRTSVSWPDAALLERARKAATQDDRSLSNLIVRAVREYLDRRDGPPPGAISSVEARLAAEAAVEASAVASIADAPAKPAAISQLPRGRVSSRIAPTSPRRKDMLSR